VYILKDVKLVIQRKSK